MTTHDPVAEAMQRVIEARRQRERGFSSASRKPARPTKPTIPTKAAKAAKDGQSARTTKKGEKGRPESAAQEQAAEEQEIELPSAFRATAWSGKRIPTGPDGRRLRRNRDFVSVGDVLGAEIKKRGWEKDLSRGWVTGNWEDLVGPYLAEHTEVKMFKETTLFIECDSTPMATNLRAMQREILQSIAKKVGPNVVTELKIFGPKTYSWRFGPLHVKGRGPRDTYG